MIYGYWNPMPVMALAIAAAAVLSGLFWLLRAAGWPKEGGRSPAGFYDTGRRVAAMLTPPWASAFWAGTARAVGALAGRARLVYTGDGRTYNLYILYYFLMLYMAGGGLRQLWPGGWLAVGAAVAHHLDAYRRMRHLCRKSTSA